VPRCACANASVDLQLAPDDELAFCCVNMADATGQFMEARLVELLCTSRAAGSVLGCFSLKLPMFANKPSTDDAAADVPIVELQGHALTDAVFLSEVPLEVTVPDLMRLFGKLGGKLPR